ncbi:MAG: hypothetical protein ABIW82_09655 [Dokdonella sp.]
MSANEPAWQEEIGRRRALGEALEFDPVDFAAAVGTPWPDASLQSFLDKAVTSGTLDRVDAWRCPNPNCRRTLDAGMVESGECPHCGSDFREQGTQPEVIVRYRFAGEVSRDIHWMIVVHGMNSRARWQEDFSWRIANRLKYSAPVLIYKYGWATIDVLVAWRHRQLAQDLGARIRRAIADASEHGITDLPDVVVHSFGSRLFALLLGDPSFADLSFGRVICAGSVVRPDFNWSALIEVGRIEAVLNHVGGNDATVPLAQFLIPGSGPGGKVGYLDERCLNVCSADFGHSSCLSEATMEQTLAENGLWDRFLRHPLKAFSADGLFTAQRWKPAWAPLRWFTRLIGVLIFALLAPISAVRRLFDP